MSFNQPLVCASGMSTVGDVIDGNRAYVVQAVQRIGRNHEWYSRRTEKTEEVTKYKLLFWKILDNEPLNEEQLSEILSLCSWKSAEYLTKIIWRVLSRSEVQLSGVHAWEVSDVAERFSKLIQAPDIVTALLERAKYLHALHEVESDEKSTSESVGFWNAFWDYVIVEVQWETYIFKKGEERKIIWKYKDTNIWEPTYVDGAPEYRVFQWVDGTQWFAVQQESLVESNNVTNWTESRIIDVPDFVSVNRIVVVKKGEGVFLEWKDDKWRDILQRVDDDTDFQIRGDYDTDFLGEYGLLVTYDDKRQLKYPDLWRWRWITSGDNNRRLRWCKYEGWKVMNLVGDTPCYFYTWDDVVAIWKLDNYRYLDLPIFIVERKDGTKDLYIWNTLSTSNINLDSLIISLKRSRSSGVIEYYKVSWRSVGDKWWSQSSTNVSKDNVGIGGE